MLRYRKPPKDDHFQGLDHVFHVTRVARDSPDYTNFGPKIQSTMIGMRSNVVENLSKNGEPVRIKFRKFALYRE